MTDSEIKHCRICQSPGAAYAVTPATADAPPGALLKCPRCGQVWKGRAIRAPLSLAGEVVTRGFSIQHASLVLEHLPETVVRAPGIRVLDVGCWDGAVLADFPASWVRHGIEPHPGAARLAAQRGLTVFNTPLESVPLATVSYDVIVLLDVFEHLEDPLAALQKLSTALAPGGYLVALTGNAASLGAQFYKGCWYYCNYPEHVTFFCPSSVRTALHVAGLDLVRLEQRRHHSATLGVTLQRILRRLRARPTKDEDALPLPTSMLELIKLAASRLLRGRDHLLLLAQKPGGATRP
jgi:2-polyprenyl-3-methyl-5-hydroxy-6-metoxy-1,4-benzoquinol methylase